MKSSQLLSLEEHAKRNAEKRIADTFQRADQLENIDLIRTRFLNQKTATEAQLKMAVHGQLDGIQNGLERLESALAISKSCRKRSGEIEASLKGLSGLSESLAQLRVLSTKHRQLAAAMENMSYLVKVPECMEQARNSIETENLLEAHKRIQELEGIRDEIMSDVFKQNSSADLDTLRTFFKGLDDINRAMLDKIKRVGATLTSAVITQNVLCVNCVRIIDREERVQGCSVDRENEKNRLVRHNEAIRQHALTDLRIAKNIFPTVFPADYHVFDRFVEIYHDAIGAHLETLINNGLNDTEIVQLLGWINAYHTEEFMKHPLFNVDFSLLKTRYPPNLLPDEKLMSLRQEYVKKTILRLRNWLVKSLNVDVEDWKRATKPEVNDASNYYTPLSVLVLSPINELVGEGKLLHFLGNAVRENFLVQCVQEISAFSADYISEIRKYRNAYLQNRASFPFYCEYILANANNSLSIAESFSAVINREVERDAQLKGRLLPQLNRLKTEYESVASQCMMCVEETIFLDLNKVLAAVLTREWLSPADLTPQCLTGTLLDYNETLIHANEKYYKTLLPRIATRLLVILLRFHVGCILPSPLRTLHFSDFERRTAGEKIVNTSKFLVSFFEEQLPVSKEICEAYKAIGLIGQFLITDDHSMLSLDVMNLQRSFPDVRTEQLYAILMLRGDMKTNEAKEVTHSLSQGSVLEAKQSLKEKLEGIIVEAEDLALIRFGIRMLLLLIRLDDTTPAPSVLWHLHARFFHRHWWSGGVSTGNGVG
ncbi:unnamed protein product [Schistocephalus solidus]|uniref:Exocyst complex component Sec6 n=1 Tax=Schistocephalus solidus TaxID=70667 RepID=A0A183SZ73_SCHSO|nr:unnamed protein product [Schistocephalus solidus]